MNRPAEASPVSILVLARLLPPGDKGETRDKLGKDLLPLVQHRWKDAAWADLLDQVVEELISAGLLVRIKKGKTDRFALTAEGGRRALDGLGLDDLPPKATWAKLKSPYLLARALGRPTPDGAEVKRLSSAPGLKAELLRARYGLALGERPTLKQATDALAGKLLGLEPEEPFALDSILRKYLRRDGIEMPPNKKIDLKGIGEALFRRESGEPGVKNPLDRIVTRSVDARQSKAPELVDGAIRSWIDRSEGTTKEIDSAPHSLDLAPLSLDEFSRRVVKGARASASGWFGDGKVFISHVWRSLHNDPAFGGMDGDAFKARLIEAHRARLIELGRADLVAAMDPADVRESATPYMNAVYHFVRTEGEAR